MKVTYIKCHHGNLIKDCRECEEEKQEAKSKIFEAAKVKEKSVRIPITRGCPNTTNGGACFCTGKCQEVIGYYE